MTKYQCKGLFFRAATNTYLSKHKSIESRNSLRLLKALSCPGCPKCGWIWEILKEDIPDGYLNSIINNIQHGKLYKLNVITSGGSYEYPKDVDVDYELIEINERELYRSKNNE